MPNLAAQQLHSALKLLRGLMLLFVSIWDGLQSVHMHALAVHQQFLFASTIALSCVRACNMQGTHACRQYFLAPRGFPNWWLPRLLLCSEQPCNSSLTQRMHLQKPVLCGWITIHPCKRRWVPAARSTGCRLCPSRSAPLCSYGPRSAGISGRTAPKRCLTLLLAPF